ncbi:MAG: acetate--CoA ligase family protein [Magnetococcales bacterium]|nr:acetate--CoA ligase family protein [Magnetococcales bacterium]
MLEALLTPKSIAVIVTTEHLEAVWFEILTNLIEGGYAGEVLPISTFSDYFVIPETAVEAPPPAQPIDSLGESGNTFVTDLPDNNRDRAVFPLKIKCHPTLKESKKQTDLAIIISQAPEAVQSVKDALRAGAKALILIPSGYQEANESGARVQQEIVELCQKRQARVVGPNCLGVINSAHKMNAAFAKTLPTAGGLSLISQSGALCASLLDWMSSRHLGLAKMLSIGNKADLNEIDCLKYLARDDETRVIICYLESINDGDAFIRAAEEAATRKPVIVQKVGNSVPGAKAVYLHTGRVSGKATAYGAAFKRSGVIHAENYETLLDYANAFSQLPLAQGDRVGLITNADGPGIMALDALDTNGLRAARFTDDTFEKLQSSLPKDVRIGLAVNLQENASAEDYSTALEIILADRETDAVLVILSPLAMTDPARTARLLAGHVNPRKPVLASFMGGIRIADSYDILNRVRIPNHQSPERAISTLAAMRRYAEWLSRPPRIVTRFLVNQRRVERIISRRLRTRRFQIMGLRAKEILSAYGFTIPEGKLTTRVDEAIEISRRLGFPVSMHLSSPDITPKSSSDSSRHQIIDVEGVRDTFDLMTFRFKQTLPNGRLDGIYIEKMPPQGQEVVIGMNRDPHFGPMLMFGLGGFSVEVMRDVSFHLAPITADEALQMLKSTRAFSLLSKNRGINQIDLLSIAESLQRISQLATEFPLISEILINPLIVGGAGTIPFAIDAHFTLTEPTEPS